MDNGLNNRSRISDFVCMLPAFIFILSILLVRLHLFSMPLTDVYWTEALDTSTLSDMFSYWKAITILCAGLLAILVVVVAYFKDAIRFKKSFLYIPALVYVGFVLLSLAFSNYKYFALRGMQEHFEGTAVILSYIFLLLFLFNAVDSERRVKMVIICALSVAFLLGLLGLGQALGHDFFTTVIGQKAITPNYTLDNGLPSWAMIDIMAEQGKSVYNFSFTDGEVYQTVYNINYVPLYLSLLIPISAILFVFYWAHESKRIRAISIVFLAVYGVLLYNFFAANSASGYFGLLVYCVAVIVIFRNYCKCWIKPIVCLLVVSGLIIGLLTNRWLPEVRSILKATIQDMTTTVFADTSGDIQYDFENEAASALLPVDFVETVGSQIRFGINGSAFRITEDGHSSFAITDDQDNQLLVREIDNDPGVFEILDERFHDAVKVGLAKDSNESVFVIISTKVHDWRFLFADGEFSYVNVFNKSVKLSIVPHASALSESFGSTRGRIWNTTQPILKNFIIKGGGADTFAFIFPQNDYATLYSLVPYGSQLNLVTDKAHNLYIQYWVNTGLLSLIAWCVLVCYYLIGAVKSFKRNGFVVFVDYVNGGIFCGILAFLAVAFFNDGSVNTMPMFYTMLGTGLAINAKAKWIKTDP